MKLYRSKKNGKLYFLFRNSIGNLSAEPFNRGMVCGLDEELLFTKKGKRRILREDDFEEVADLGEARPINLEWKEKEVKNAYASEEYWKAKAVNHGMKNLRKFSEKIVVQISS